MPAANINVTCSGSELVELDQLVPFQDALKALAPARAAKLEQSILKYGVTFPFFIWRRGRELLVLDGHQRETVLKKMRDDGFAVPKLPAVSIQAGSEKEAKEKILLLSSQYGEITEGSLKDYLAAAGIELSDLVGTVQLPNVDIDRLVKQLIAAGQVDDDAPPLVGDVQLIHAEALAGLRQLPDESVHCVVTSPPYWGLRDYGTAEWEGGDDDCDHQGAPLSSKSTLAGYTSENVKLRTNFTAQKGGTCKKCGARRIDDQLGLEKTPEEYVARLVGIAREVRRVLRKDGTLWLNLGDCWATGAGKVGDHPGGGAQGARYRGDHGKDPKSAGIGPQTQPNRLPIAGLKPKDLVGIPWRVAFALQADGWYLRSEIIWSKPNPMPESVEDRPTKEHEQIFLLSKSDRYFFDADAVREPNSEKWAPSKNTWASRKGKPYEDKEERDAANLRGDNFRAPGGGFNPAGRNIRSVWEITLQPYAGAHFATFPEELPRRCILAGTSARGCCAKCGAPQVRVTDKERAGELVDYDGKWKGADSEAGARRMLANVRARRRAGADHDAPFPAPTTLGWQPSCKCAGKAAPVPCVVLDFFAGSGTTGAVALDLGRKAILIELNAKYLPLIRRRCAAKG